MRWEELREEQFEEAIERSKGVCVIPIGCPSICQPGCNFKHQRQLIHLIIC